MAIRKKIHSIAKREKYPLACTTGDSGPPVDARKEYSIYVVL